MRSRHETWFAILTIVLALIHFAGETYVHFAFGQTFLGYFIDLIVITLMLIAGIASLRVRPVSASGWLAAAWGTAFCLAYRAFAWRYHVPVEERGGEPAIILNILAGALVISTIAFAFAFWLARPRKT